MVLNIYGRSLHPPLPLFDLGRTADSLIRLSFIILPYIVQLYQVIAYIRSALHVEVEVLRRPDHRLRISSAAPARIPDVRYSRSRLYPRLLLLRRALFVARR